MQNLERPDGSVVTPIGWLFIGIGVVGLVIAIAAETINWTAIGFGLANLGFVLGVLLLSLGYLVRAIWFLPGREIPAGELDATTAPSVAASTCEWCARRAPAGYRTCTSYSQEDLESVSRRVVDPICKEQLRERGYPVADPYPQ